MSHEVPGPLHLNQPLFSPEELESIANGWEIVILNGRQLCTKLLEDSQLGRELDQFDKNTFGKKELSPIATRKLNEFSIRLSFALEKINRALNSEVGEILIRRQSMIDFFESLNAVSRGHAEIQKFIESVLGGGDPDIVSKLKTILDDQNLDLQDLQEVLKRAAQFSQAVADHHAVTLPANVDYDLIATPVSN